MRLFVAIELPAELQHKLAKLTLPWQKNIRGKWVETHNLHLTLAFLGEVNESMVLAITKAVSKATNDSSPFDLLIGNIIGLPYKHPRTLALTVARSSAYKKLQQDIIRELSKIRITASGHEPHLTLVRLKQPAPISNLPSLNLRVKVSQISLMQSTLTPKGPVYKRLEALKLSSGASSGPLRPNIAICVINPKNEVLLIRSRLNNQRDWQLPQGGIEAGETLVQTARRELKEEVGIEKITIIKILEKVYKYEWSSKLIAKNKGTNKEGFIGQQQSLAIVRVLDVRPILKLNPREATNSKWVDFNILVKSTSPVRRGLAKLVMVELNKMISKDS